MFCQSSGTLWSPVADGLTSLTSAVERDTDCLCCFDVMLNPITLGCGHTLCELCLATSYLHSRKKICPVCRSKWSSIPNVNFAFRSLIEHLFARKVAEKKRQLTEEDRMVLAEWNQWLRCITAMEKHVPGASSYRDSLELFLNDNRAWFYAAFGAVAVLFISSCFNSILNSFGLVGCSRSDLFTFPFKDVEKWSAYDVKDILINSGEWATPYLDKIIELDIDGSTLMQLYETDIRSKIGLNVTSDAAFSRFLMLAQYSRELRNSMVITHVTDFIAHHPIRSIFCYILVTRLPRLYFLSILIFQGLTHPFILFFMRSNALNCVWLIPSFVFAPYAPFVIYLMDMIQIRSIITVSILYGLTFMKSVDSVFRSRELFTNGLRSEMEKRAREIGISLIMALLIPLVSFILPYFISIFLFCIYLCFDVIFTFIRFEIRVLDYCNVFTDLASYLWRMKTAQ